MVEGILEDISSLQTIHLHRWAETENQERLWKDRVEKGLPLHLHPGSTLIAAMGPHSVSYTHLTLPTTPYV